MNNFWFVIVNPTSGNGKGIKKLTTLKNLFKKYKINVKIVFSEYAKHESKLSQNAIKEGFTQIISVGGDGTLHHIVNGIMSQQIINTSKIKLAVIPVGTGNDWVKTYNISKNFEKAIQIIKKENFVYQDIGLIKFLLNNKEVYFNNAAGIGFDAYVVNKISSYKKLGSISYLLGGLIGFLNYKKSTLQINIGNKKINSKTFMLSIGLCKFSGGGMQLTYFKDHQNGLFDITLIKNIKLYKVLINIKKLYNGKLINLKEVESFQNDYLKIKVFNKQIPYIQADGELLGKGNIEIQLIPKAINFIIP